MGVLPDRAPGIRAPGETAGGPSPSRGKGITARQRITAGSAGAKATCRARAEKNVELAFGPVGKKPPLISNEEMGKFLKQGEDVARWIADLQDCALAQCLAGKDVPGWKAVEGRGSREWTDLDKAFRGLETAGVEAELLWEEKTPVRCPGRKGHREKRIRGPGQRLCCEEAGKTSTGGRVGQASGHYK